MARDQCSRPRRTPRPDAGCRTAPVQNRSQPPAHINVKSTTLEPRTHMTSVLVTGGAGYIGSHTLLQLTSRGENVVVLDDLSTGFRQAVRDVPLVVGNVGDRALVDRLLVEHRVDTIIHFAAHTIVPESVSDPLKYYGNNTCSTRSLLAAAANAGVKNIVFSSTAAVYGIPESGLASEDTLT